MKFDKGIAIFEEDLLTEVIRREVRGVIERIVIEELEGALGVGFYQRDQGLVRGIVMVMNPGKFLLLWVKLLYRFLGEGFLLKMAQCLSGIVKYCLIISGGSSIDTSLWSFCQRSDYSSADFGLA